MLVVGSWSVRLLVLASVCNFLLFFGRDILVRIGVARRRMSHQAKRFAEKPPEYYHRCLVCGITDRTHPHMEFRYCSKCAGSCCYCSEHLRNHDHVAAEVDPAKT